MGLIFTDNFKSYAATSDLLKKWATAQTPWAWSATGGPDGGPCITATTSAASIITPAGLLTNSGTRFCFGFFSKISAIVGSAAGIRVTNSVGADIVLLRTHSSGTLGSIQAIANGGSTIFTGVRNICDNQWHWIEVDINTVVSQTLRLYVDGVLEFSGYLFTLASAPVDRFSFVSAVGATVSIGNVVFWDNNGSGLNASHFPLGPRNITTLRPNGDGAVQFTRSSGSSSYALVDEVNGDTSDYVESGTGGAQDLYDYGALGYAPATINAVMLNSYVHNPNPGTISIQGVCKSSATTSPGTAAAIPSVTAATKQQPFELDPNGNTPWTQANLDAAQFGIKVA